MVEDLLGLAGAPASYSEEKTVTTWRVQNHQVVKGSQVLCTCASRRRKGEVWLTAKQGTCMPMLTERADGRSQQREADRMISSPRPLSSAIACCCREKIAWSHGQGWERVTATGRLALHIAHGLRVAAWVWITLDVWSGAPRRTRKARRARAAA